MAIEELMLAMIAPGCSSYPLPIAHCSTPGPNPYRDILPNRPVFRAVRVFRDSRDSETVLSNWPLGTTKRRLNGHSDRTKLVRIRIATPVAIADKRPEYKERVDASRGTATISAIAA